MKNWEYNVLGVYNYKVRGKLDPYFKNIVENHDRVPGDIVEAGVFEGRSFLATALVLRDLNSTKKVYGYDSFSGFPPVYDTNDDLAMFDTLLSQGRIGQEHYDDFERLKRYRRLTNVEPNVQTISTSGTFSSSNRELLERKIDLLDVGKWAVIRAGTFDETMRDGQDPEQVMAALMDCDLYQSYRVALEFVWKRMPVGGYIWLDEYYSLKFAGALVACDEFFATKSDKPQLHAVEPGEFERWFVRRLSLKAAP